MGPGRAQAGEGRSEGGGAGDVEVHRLRRPLPIPSRGGAGEGWRQRGRAGDACCAAVSAADAEFLLSRAAPATAEERDPAGRGKLKRGAGGVVSPRHRRRYFFLSTRKSPVFTSKCNLNCPPSGLLKSTWCSKTVRASWMRNLR